MFIQKDKRVDLKFRRKILDPNSTQAEGFVTGLGVKMFTIAGPVIVYGVSASVVCGIIYRIWKMI